MSVELAMMTGMIGGAFLLFNQAQKSQNTAGEQDDAENSPSWFQKFYIGVGLMFLTGAMFVGGQIAGAHSYNGIQNAFNWIFRGTLLILILYSALVLYDFYSQIMDAINSGNLKSDDWGW